MAISITCQSLTKAADGRVHLVFSDGTGVSFLDVASAHAWANELEGFDEYIKKCVMLYVLKRSPDLSNVSGIVGKTMTIDWTKNPNQIITVT